MNSLSLFQILASLASHDLNMAVIGGQTLHAPAL